MKGCAVIILLFIVLTGCASLPTKFYSLSNGTKADLRTVLRTAEDSRVIFIGEFHGIASTHLLQLEVVRYLHEKGIPVIVALEAFPASRQEVLDQWIEGSLSPYDFEQTYQGIWSIPYDFYEDLFAFARGQRIPLVGINADDGLIRTVSAKGVDAVSSDLILNVKFSRCEEDPRYAKVLGLTQYHREEYPHLCDGQRLRDAVMAYHISRIVKKGRGTVVVILGVAHAVKVAVPAMLLKQADVSFTVLLPEKVSAVIGKNPGPEIADYIWESPGL